MKFEIVESVPSPNTRKSRRSQSMYDEALSSAMDGAVVKIPATTSTDVNGIRTGLIHVIKRRGLPLRAVARDNAVYLERNDV